MLRATLFAMMAYLIGAFPSSFLAGRARGVDLRRRGSGNLGAANVYRTLGGRMAGLVVVVDVAKGFIPVWFFPVWDGAVSPSWSLMYGLLAIFGHVWSVFTRLHGGKGVATACGVLLALEPLAAVIGVLTWSGLILLTGIASVASLAAVSIIPLITYAAAAPGDVILFATLMALLVWWTHRHNVRRLLRREEPRLGEPLRRRKGEGKR
ncbi:MAG: glycerol-3-phosphate 1-O-acyltransferase PlsY [Gemmatimonadota bacterium]